MVKKFSFWCLFFSILTSFTGEIFSQSGTCNITVVGKNAYREVLEDVNAECPGNWPHSYPFGNWGINSNFGTRDDLNQFDGWCHSDYLCDNYDNCANYCGDGWYEWNSCLDNSMWSSPNDDFYNLNSHTQQQSITWDTPYFVDTVDSLGVNLSVDCPRDTDNNGTCDVGGCDDVVTVTIENSYMTLYELDPWDTDFQVQTLNYNNITVYPVCSIDGCNEVSSAAYPIKTSGGYTSPSSPQRVNASLGIQAYGTYGDSQDCIDARWTDEELCCDSYVWDTECQ